MVHAVQHGMTNREIATRRGVSPDAVKFHIANAMAKLGVPSRKALRHWFRAPKGSALSAQEKIAREKIAQEREAVAPITDGVEEWMAFFKNPDGRPLAIMSQVKPT